MIVLQRDTPTTQNHSLSVIGEKINDITTVCEKLRASFFLGMTERIVSNNCSLFYSSSFVVVLFVCCLFVCLFLF